MGFGTGRKELGDHVAVRAVGHDDRETRFGVDPSDLARRLVREHELAGGLLRPARARLGEAPHHVRPEGVQVEEEGAFEPLGQGAPDGGLADPGRAGNEHDATSGHGATVPRIAATGNPC